MTLSNQTPRYIHKCIRICNKTSGTEILYSKYRIALHKMSELDEISDSGIEMHSYVGGRTGLMVRALDSGSGDPGSILGRVGVFVSLSKRHLLPKSTGNTQE